MKKIGIYLFLATFFTIVGCASPTGTTQYYDVPVDYLENKATVLDSFQTYSLSGTEFFVVSAIDGKAVDNAYTLSRSFKESGGRIVEYGYWRFIPNREVKLELSVITRAPIAVLLLAPTIPTMALVANSPNIIKAEIHFQPQKDQTYQVNGFISQSYVALWLEDLDGKIVSEIAELAVPDVDRAAMHTMLDYKRRRSIGHRSAVERFLNLRGGDKKDTLIDKLGMPAAEEIVPSKRRGFERVAYNYEGLGLVVFGNQFAKSNEFTTYINPNFASIDFNDAINTTNPLMRQAFARYYIKEGDLNAKQLDKIAASLWLWRHSDNVNVVESNALFCRILAKSGNPIYRPILEQISNETNIEKLKRYAQTSLQQLDEASANTVQ